MSAPFHISGPALRPKTYRVKIPIVALVEAASELDAKVKLATYVERKARLVDASSWVFGPDAEAFESEPLEGATAIVR